MFLDILLIFTIAQTAQVRGQSTGHGSTFTNGSPFPSRPFTGNTFSSGSIWNVSGKSTTPIFVPADPLHGRRIVCIFNNMNYYRSHFTPMMMDPMICTHINYEFAILDPKTYEMIPGEPDLDIRKDFFDEAVNLKKLNPKLKVLLSIGGWMDSTEKYSELVDSNSRMDNFIQKAIPFLKSHGFDGLDVAWEYPNCWQGELGVSPKDKKNFATFLQKLRDKFDPEGLILSVSVGAVKREILEAYDGPAISKAVHYVNVMTYDMHGPWERRTGHHSQFDRKYGDSDPFLNSIAALGIWANLGVKKGKLNVGIPTYAKTFTLVDPNNHGHGAPTRGPGRPGPMTQQGGFLCYSELCQFLNAGNWSEAEDTPRGFYAYSDDQWATYDPPMMGVKKAEWIIQQGFGGVLVKDISCDDHMGFCLAMPYPIIKMTRMEMIHKLKKLHYPDLS